VREETVGQGRGGRDTAAEIGLSACHEAAPSCATVQFYVAGPSDPVCGWPRPTRSGAVIALSGIFPAARPLPARDVPSSPVRSHDSPGRAARSSRQIRIIQGTVS
jgi:hypothetical protein